ncbi:MAG: hypothetical protein IID61_09035, partial [SAR324 cluster bacterium]|nr:hypothetical protein [SAR324 cluster bacterium]
SGVQANATPDSIPPGTVTSLTAAFGDSQVMLVWINPADADFSGTRLCWATSGFPADPTSCGSFVDKATPATSHTVTGLNNGTFYYFAVFAFDGLMNFASSEQAYGKPTSLVAPAQVSAGGDHTCALDAGGVVCWGRNLKGQTDVPALTSPTQVSAGREHTCALDNAGVVCWGFNSSGQTDVP